MYKEAETLVSRMTELPADAELQRELYRPKVEPVGDFVIRQIVKAVGLCGAKGGTHLVLHTLDGKGQYIAVIPSAFCRERGLRRGQIISLPEFEPQGYC